MSWVLTLCSDCLSLPPSGPGVPYFVSIVAATSAGEGEPNEKILFTEERGEGSTDGFLDGTPLSSTSALYTSLWGESGEADLHCNECQLDPPDSGGGKRVCHQLHSLLQEG